MGYSEHLTVQTCFSPFVDTRVMRQYTFYIFIEKAVTQRGREFSRKLQLIFSFGDKE